MLGVVGMVRLNWDILWGGQAKDVCPRTTGSSWLAGGGEFSMEASYQAALESSTCPGQIQVRFPTADVCPIPIPVGTCL